MNDMARTVSYEQTPPTISIPIRVYERKALNFLVNEYLLQNDFKLSAVTLSEEVDDQVRDLVYEYLKGVEISGDFTFTS